MAKKISQNQAIKMPVKLEKAGVAKPKAVKLIEKKKWGNLTPADCLKSIKTASHLSSKSVNSNASPVGVRLDPAERLPLHYVAVSTLDAAKIPVDYVMGATDAGTLKQITSVLDGTCNEFFTEIDPAQMAMIEAMRGSIDSAESVGTGFVDPRLRQVIWPTEDEGAPWLALTPLQSSGLSEVIRSRLNIEADANINPVSKKTTIRRSNAVMGIGGSNPQNVGRHVRAMQRPLVFDGPKEVKTIRAAYALQLCAYIEAIELKTGIAPRYGFIVTGDGKRHRIDEQAATHPYPCQITLRDERTHATLRNAQHSCCVRSGQHVDQRHIRRISLLYRQRNRSDTSA